MKLGRTIVTQMLVTLQHQDLQTLQLPDLMVPVSKLLPALPGQMLLQLRTLKATTHQAIQNQNQATSTLALAQILNQTIISLAITILKAIKDQAALMAIRVTQGLPIRSQMVVIVNNNTLDLQTQTLHHPITIADRVLLVPTTLDQIPDPIHAQVTQEQILDQILDLIAVPAQIQVQVAAQDHTAARVPAQIQVLAAVLDRTVARVLAAAVVQDHPPLALAADLRLLPQAAVQDHQVVHLDANTNFK